MRIVVGYQDGSLDFEVAEDRLVGHWDGSPLGDLPDLAAATRAAIEGPTEFPPLALAAVPGDRVVLAFDGDLAGHASALLGPIAGVLRGAEVGSITAISTAPRPANFPEEILWEVHDPDDKAGVAYLASTQEGQRVYLNRAVTDADLVIPIGLLGPDANIGCRGPWSALYPALSHRETLARYGAMVAEGPVDAEAPPPGLAESAEVGWLLGCQFQVGALRGRSEIARIIAGLDAPARAEGIAAVEAAWSFRVEERADLVVAGIGPSTDPGSIDDLAEGLAAATRLVRRGGKIVALARTAGPLGPAVKRLAGAENPRAAANRLRGHEGDPDYPAARKLAAAIAWADVYLYSGLDRDLVDDLAMVPLDRPEEARKLASAAASCTFIGQAERTRAILVGE